MTSPRIKQTLTALLCGLLAAAFVSACSAGDNTATGGDHGEHSADAGHGAHGAHGDGSPVIAEAPAAFNDADVTFATNMVPHHEQAIELVGLVDGRSTNPDLIKLAQQISAAQQPEITTMNAFLVQWRGGESAPADHSGHAGMAGMAGMVDAATMARLATLEGAEFDTLWLQSMIGHHQGAIEMADAELANGTNADAKTLARDIVTAQQAEIAQMQQMAADKP